jgi:HAD superfamily hydrolase (TIGR01509 family)
MPPKDPGRTRRARRFRALSLDLWFTSIFYAPGLDAQWEEDRLRAVRAMLRASDGGSVPVERIEAGLTELEHRHPAGPARIAALEPRRLVTDLARLLDAQLTLDPEAAARRFSAAGLDEHPPELNPELPGVLDALRARGVPAILVTNTARREETWREFLEDRGVTGFQAVVTSCEAGCAKPDPRIFRIAGRRLGLEPSAILHVGDRWELDVAGAAAAGCGAALYRGLWDRYPPGVYPEAEAKELIAEEVLQLDRLDQLLTADVWAPGDPGGGVPGGVRR